LGKRYGFGRIDVRRVKDSEQAVSYLCKYLSKPRVRCLNAHGFGLHSVKSNGRELRT
jgi:hypothetical protein